MGSYYDDPVVREINERLNIIDVVSETVALSRKGNRYWGLCPFHQEKTSSFTVTPERNMFYCFGCHAGGDMFNFVMLRDGIEFKDALQLLAAKAGVEIRQAMPKKEIDRRRQIIEINKTAAEYYSACLQGNKGGEAREYLQRRGLEAKTIEKFYLGLATDSWNSLEEHLLKKGFSPELIKDAGLIKRSDKNNSYYDLFRQRIMFPINGINGEIIGFGGRVMDAGQPKYLNTPETEIYAKRMNLYGFYQARETIRHSNEVVLVEGYMDCIKMHQAEITNCVATLGTSLTREQARLIRRYAEKVIVIYDGDEAGQREALRAGSILLEEDLRVQVLILPQGQDPDDLIELYGKEEFKRYIQNNKCSFIEFKIIRLINTEKDLNLDAKIRVIQAVKTDITRLESEIEKDFYTRILAQKLSLEENLVQRELQAGSKTRTAGVKNKTGINRDNIQYGNYSNYNIEEKILAAMLLDDNIFNQIKNRIGLGFFSKPQYRELAAKYDEIPGDQEQRWQALSQEINEEALRSSWARITVLMEEDTRPGSVEIEAYIQRVERLRLKARWGKMHQRLNQLREEGDFYSLLEFILQIDSFLHHTRKGGTA
ncbi:DNA primase [Syntrophomonas palmitatica]|uniref:DNA primase n=1 Tax=Syntrophomonas palmitatica TaxID=402877 RepID=UPI0006CF90BA|nr:DNA primase [Syntrophomonas palmitatica]